MLPWGIDYIIILSPGCRTLRGGTSPSLLPLRDSRYTPILKIRARYCPKHGNELRSSTVSPRGFLEPLCCNPEVHTIIHWDVTTPGHLFWCTVIHCLMFSTLTSNSTSLIGLCSASNILAFHRSDGSLSISAFPTVALAARRALFQVVAWNTLVIILVVSTSIRTGDYLECKIEDF